jgi:hypothetical protein
VANATGRAENVQRLSLETATDHFGVAGHWERTRRQLLRQVEFRELSTPTARLDERVGAQRLNRSTGHPDREESRLPRLAETEAWALFRPTTHEQDQALYY